MAKLVKRKSTWKCGFRKCEVVVEQEFYRTTGGMSGKLYRQRCLDEHPDECDDKCLFLGGEVNPRSM